jgi:hypothetical protein
MIGILKGKSACVAVDKVADVLFKNGADVAG